MEPLSINEIVSLLKDEFAFCYGLLPRLPPAVGISIDTRTIKENEVFVALKGARDGHEFVESAFDKKAVAAIVSNEWATSAGSKFENKTLIAVKDTLKALQTLASGYRDRFNIQVVAITGSNGKTTTKDMSASILSQEYKVLKSEGNLNNHIGVPLTLMNLDKSHQFAVIEMGMSGLGEIAKLADIAKPNIGVITNIAPVHLEFLGDVSNVRKAKLELAEKLGLGNTLILNADDKILTGKKIDTKATILTFGITNQKAKVKAGNLKCSEDGNWSFTLKYNKEQINITLPIIGKHNIYNALASASVGISLNIELAKIKLALENFKPTKMRMEVIRTDKLTILNDCYNANPSSMENALITLSSFSTKGKRIAVLGDMFELGEKSPELHSDVGKAVANSKVNTLIAVGKLAKFIAEGAIKNKMKKGNVYHCADNKQAIETLHSILNADDVVLIKGSRGMKMEEIVEELKNSKQVISKQ